MPILLFLIYSVTTLFTLSVKDEADLQGAWKSDNGVLIISGQYFAYTSYSTSEFKYTYGGQWKLNEGQLSMMYEFNTEESNLVGSEVSSTVEVKSGSLRIGDVKYQRIDDGTPGELAGPWLFNNRYRDGKLGNPRNNSNPRKTMKILSGTRFQWIAYNVETKEFFGTGGGTFTTIDGKYTELIDFFSRDQSRVGAKLEFDYEMDGDIWNHTGFSSKGDPMHELWKKRD